MSASQVEEEQDPEERDHFLQQLYKFMEDRGQLHVRDHVCPSSSAGHLSSKTGNQKSLNVVGRRSQKVQLQQIDVCVCVYTRGSPINKPRVLGYKDLNLFKLFRLVCHYGGCRKVSGWGGLVGWGYRISADVAVMVSDRVWDHVEAGLRGSGNPRPKLCCLLQR